MRFRSLVSVPVVLGLTALSLAACKSSSSGSSSGSSTGSGGSSSAGGGGGGKTVTVATDLPLQGTNKDANDSTNKMIQLYLDEHGGKAGNYTIKLKFYDDSIASTGAWDPSTCSKNAQQHIADASEIAVMGTFNSGCAKLEVPILNGGPLLMVSDANTSPGLTKAYAGNDPGEPDKYYPSGKRNYARVVTTDDYQGTAAATFAKDNLKVSNCYVINDNSTYGTGIAKSFATNAVKDGIKILGNESWDPKASNYTALMTKIKGAGAQCIYLGGTFDQNGGQLVKDKFNVLGDNEKVKMFAPDGFTGYPALDKLSQSQGMYLTFAGLATEQLQKQAGAGAKLLAAYKTKYGSAPVGSYPLYGAAAMQVIMAAIAKSDGTRQGVVDAVFGSSPITISAADSVLGKALEIDPKTGDVNAKDISVLKMTNHQEAFLQPESVK